MKNFVSSISARLSGELIVPFFLIAIYIVFLVAVKGVIPTAQEILAYFTKLYQSYGYEIIFVSALLEALVVINFFVPGLMAMSLGAIFARAGHLELTLVILAAISGLVIGYTIDFLLGYFGFGDILKKIGYGWVLTKARGQLDKFGDKGLILGFAYPNVASFLSLGAGTLKFKFLYFFFLAAISSLFWIPLWGILIYSVGEIFLTILTRYSFLVVTVVIASLVLLRMLRK